MKGVRLSILARAAAPLFVWRCPSGHWHWRCRPLCGFGDGAAGYRSPGAAGDAARAHYRARHSLPFGFHR